MTSRRILPASLLCAALVLLAPALAQAELVTTNIVQGTDPGKSTAVVNYTVPSTTTDGYPLDYGPPACMPPPGSTFPLGVTTVNCSGTGAGPLECTQMASPPASGCAVFGATPETENGSFTVTIKDEEPPQLSQPPDEHVTAPAGAKTVPVSFALPPATDNVGVVSEVCTPPPGSQFPIGTTTVTCVAKDAAGNATTKTFDVVVASATVANGGSGQCVVPSLKGDKLKAAKRALIAAHCALGTVTSKQRKKHNHRVLKQDPKAGTIEPPGARVNLTVARRG